MADLMTLEDVRGQLSSWFGDSEACGDVKACDRLGEMINALDAAIKQREQDAKDAARYRHMIETSPFMCFGASEYSKKSDLDEAIDNSIAEMEKESGNG